MITVNFSCKKRINQYIILFIHEVTVLCHSDVFKCHLFPSIQMLTAKNLTKNGGPTGKGQVTSKGTEKDGSSACSIQ